MDYGKMMFYANSSTKMSPSNCLAPPSTPSTPQMPQFKVGQAVTTTSTHTFLQLSDTTSAANYADFFDTSLLPQTNTPTENISNIIDRIFQYTNDTNITPATPTNITPQIKIEQTWSCAGATSEIKEELNTSRLYEQLSLQAQQATPKSSNQLIPPPPYPYIYPSPQSSPAQSEYGFPHAQFAGGCYDSLSSSRSSLYPPSPSPASLDASSIKQELHILPPSPPESNCEARSPHSSWVDIKSEPIDADVEALIDLNALFEKSTPAPPPPPPPPQPQQQQQQDYQLLRRNLEDTSFQLKHNLKPLALEPIIDGMETADTSDMDAFLLEKVSRYAEETCAKLLISKDPCAWSPMQVHAWLLCSIADCALPQITDLELKFPEDGAALALLSEEEFNRRIPECGSQLYAHLKIFKLALSETSAVLDDNDLDDESEGEEDTLPSTSNSVNTISVAVVVKRPSGGRSGGSHIHLWQFLKELLASPYDYGTAIRWIDRVNGIFKIEDSVRVAKLWGKRKNRPAMNYDKLSRSIRQYYKKGIMKKTERSQRLVYQFCNPYHK